MKYIWRGKEVEVDSVEQAKDQRAQLIEGVRILSLLGLQANERENGDNNSEFHTVISPEIDKALSALNNYISDHT